MAELIVSSEAIVSPEIKAEGNWQGEWSTETH